MSAKLQGYTVDMRHRRIDLRPMTGMEIRIDLRSMRERMQKVATETVDKTVDCEKIVVAEIKARDKVAKRVIADRTTTEEQKVAARRELDDIGAANMKSLVMQERNRQIAKVTERLAQENLDRLLQNASGEVLFEGWL